MGECNHEWSGFAPDCDLCGMSAADRIAELQAQLAEERELCKTAMAKWREYLKKHQNSEAQLAEKTKEFDSLLKRDTSNLKRLIEAQAQLAKTHTAYDDLQKHLKKWDKQDELSRREGDE